MHEYIVTCRSYEDLEELYNDMETPGGNLYIPDRAVDLVARRNISRNTHYMLTEEEAEQVGNDPRVLACERPAQDRGIVPEELWEQTANFMKDNSFLGTDKNWGLWRIIEGDTKYEDSQSFDITITGANGNSDYIMSGTDRSGAVSGNDPNITIKSYDTITFEKSALSGAHPFEIRSSLGGSVVNDPPASGQRTDTISWTPIYPGTYYYQCTSHASMNGEIIVQPRSTDWGYFSTQRISNESILTTSSGKNVDVVIVDSHVNPDHPEFTTDPAGVGASRVNQFNWFSYSSALGITTPANYVYSTQGGGTPYNSNHGTHVAGTVAGNTQGWAREANIYNMAFSDSLSQVSNWDNYLWDYLRYFHLNKDINSETGRRNPTVTNHSWGYSYTGNFALTSLTSVRINGTVTDVSSYTTTQKKEFLENNGYYPCAGGTSVFKPVARNAAVDADLQDAISEGVIIIASAGNNYAPIVREGSDDYDNYMVFFGNTYYMWRGTSPGSADNVIAVGSLDSRKEEGKSNFSNWGPRVDIFAPGSQIISAVFDESSASSQGYGPIVADSRNGSYYLASISGTSMAGPQVAGCVACLVEQQPGMRQADVLEYLQQTCKTNIGIDGDGTTTPYRGITSNNYSNLDSNNRYLFYFQKRKPTGTIQNTLFGNRNPDTGGVKYPRRNTRVTK